MSNELYTPDGGGEYPPFRRRPSRGMVLLRTLLFAEAALLAVAALWLVFELLTEQPASLVSALVILALTVVAFAFVLAIAIGALRRQSWIRGAGIGWQLMQIAVAAGCFQGIYANPAAGWALLAPSLVVIVLLLAPGIRNQLGASGGDAEALA
ncbi:hypothetical protein SAMN04489834_1239 [Microterricola viridarii]|uniref:Uncharacterized protein n=2 Tax=Microterricola viridarii TaxID=412690 RepID=A0A1H1R4Z5_9MICO|nr:hypothetical protein SAMN04489834_1239 [Microterricola viridarii]